MVQSKRRGNQASRRRRPRLLDGPAEATHNRAEGATGAADSIAAGFAIDARFCGPPQSANGGYVGGRLASYLGGAVEVTLRRPPPLNQTLEVERPATDRVALVHSEVLLADARRAHVDLSLPASPVAGIHERDDHFYAIHDPKERLNKRLLCSINFLGSSSD
jgi:hypothetical protein